MFLRKTERRLSKKRKSFEEIISGMNVVENELHELDIEREGQLKRLEIEKKKIDKTIIAAGKEKRKAEIARDNIVKFFTEKLAVVKGK